MPPIRSANINVMDQAARKAARHLIRDFGEVEQLQVSIKGPGDFVSAADRKAEKILREELSRARPNFGFLLEESGEIPGRDGHRWIIDPLDGTTNFLHGIPHFAISIGLEWRGELIAGLVYDPIKDETFVAEKGAGAFLNERRLRVSRRNEFSRAMIGTGLPVLNWPGREKGFATQLERVSDKVAGLRRLGTASLDLAYVAAGRFDGFWEYGLKPWDVAAGIILVREAGGMVNHLEGEQPWSEPGTIVAANPDLHGQLVSLLTV